MSRPDPRLLKTAWVLEVLAQNRNLRGRVAKDPSVLRQEGFELSDEELGFIHEALGGPRKATDEKEGQGY
jgi:hypothetical protein